MPTTYAIPNGRTVMDATLYTGTNAAANITNTTGFKPDFVWIKDRSNAYTHVLVNSVTGANINLYSNQTSVEQASNSGTGVTAFNSNGFALGTNIAGTSYGATNINNDTFVAWQWQAGQGTSSSNTAGSITSTVSVNTTAGFSIVTYTGNGVQSATVGHGLGATPSLIFIKRRNTDAQDWGVYHTSLGLKLLQLNTNSGAWNSGANYWYATPTSTVFSPDNSFTDHYQNVSGANYIAYCWAPIAGYSAFGSYTGNGSSDGPFIYTGFRPRWILTKNYTVGSTNGWCLIDTARNPYNASYLILEPQNDGAEYNGTTNTSFDVLSNGFKLRGTNSFTNANGNTYIYMAFAENPFKYANAR